MREAARGRVFGGNAGLWLFQKKFRRQDNIYDSNLRRQKSTMVSVITTDVDNCSNKIELCTPIDCSPESTQLSSSSSTSGDCQSDELGNNERLGIITTNVVASTNMNAGHSRKRGVFGVRKRHFENNSSDSDSSVATSTTIQRNNSKRQCRIPTLTDTSSVQSLATSQFHLSSSPSNNHSKYSIAASESIQDRLADDSNRAFRTMVVPHVVNNVATNQTQQSESSSVFDFDKDPITQRLGCKTNLDVARQFFAQLDSDQTLLQIEDVRQGLEPPSTKKKSRIVRTTRGRLPPNVAKSEYHNYCQACHSSKIKPFSFERFLQQRSEYFRVGDVFDGMFDE